MVECIFFFIQVKIIQVLDFDNWHPRKNYIIGLGHIAELFHTLILNTKNRTCMLFTCSLLFDELSCFILFADI